MLISWKHWIDWLEDGAMSVPALKLDPQCICHSAQLTGPASVTLTDGSVVFLKYLVMQQAYAY